MNVTELLKKYKTLSRFAHPLEVSPRPIVGRERELAALHANLSRPELSSVILLGDAGVGKTALVEKLSQEDADNLYLEVVLSAMAFEGPERMATYMRELVDETRDFQTEFGHEVILFMDEFHQLLQLSPAATEAIKPILARSGQFHIKLIAATTFEEYVENVQPNQALSERLQELTLDPPEDKVIVSMLRSLVTRYAPDAQVRESLYHNIIDVSNRFMPSEHQPRKSLRILDAMLGHYIYGHEELNEQLLDKVVYESKHISTTWHADVSNLKEAIESRVKGQPLAVKTVINRLQISIANLADPTRPQASMLFTGPTGVGKTEMVKAMTQYLFGREDAMIRFDMSEYSNSASVDQFRERIADAIRRQPYAVVLLDEIEKASRNVALLLLQILDDGRLTDRYGRQVTFTNSYIVLTTNLGSEIYEDVQKSDTDAAEYIKMIREALMRGGSGLHSGFPPELVNRINEVVPFNPLTDQVYVSIVKSLMRKFTDEVKRKHNMKLHFSAKVIEFIVYEKLDRQTSGGGGRAVADLFDRYVRVSVAESINKYPDYRDISVSVEGDMAHGPHGNKHALEGTAKILVNASNV